MNRDEKAAIVAELNDSFSRAKFSVVADYCGLTVSDLEKIRRDLRQSSSEIRIAKNTLLRRAVTDTSCESLTDDFTGTTAIVVSYDDPVAPARYWQSALKIMINFSFGLLFSRERKSLSTNWLLYQNFLPRKSCSASCCR